MRRLTVALEPPYDVIVGAGALDEVAAVIEGRRRAVAVTHDRLDELHGDALRAAVASVEHTRVVTMPEGEGAKSLATVETLCVEFAQHGLARDDVVLAFGGGVVGDTAGLAAALYHRGVALVQVPTSLLAMVDAAIGGKTAVNLPEGKNLVGAFHQPLGVVADIGLLASLPDAELRCGLGEVAKYALLPEGGAVLAALGEHGGALEARDPEALGEVVAACAAIKAAVVAADPHEHSEVRVRLNYGHTFAHALETSEAYETSHGEAVAIGLVFAANLAHALGRFEAADVMHVSEVVEGLGLPTRVSGEVSAGALVAVMRRDKKARGGLTFVLPSREGLGRVDDPPTEAVDAAMRSVGVAV